MRTEKVGGIEFVSDSTSSNTDPWLIGVFADEYCGKTRLALTGPNGVGCVVTEMKSYKTLDKDSAELGKKIFKPKNPLDLIASARKASMLKSDVERQKYYQEVIKNIEDATFGLLEHKEVKIVMIDKFTQYCTWKEFAINGIGENFVKIDGKLVQRKAEVVQGIIDFITSLSQYGKPVLLNCSTKPDFEVLDEQKKPARNTFNAGSFYYLGSHTNLMVELISNPVWEPKAEGARQKKHGWHYRLNIRRCQINPNLEGPEGNPALEDDMIGLASLMQIVEPDVDIEKWM
jgi:hypothetical protein